MSKPTAIEIIRQRAKEHEALYPTFGLERFMEEVSKKPESWQNWAKGRPIAKLNKTFRYFRSIERMAWDD